MQRWLWISAVGLGACVSSPRPSPPPTTTATEPVGHEQAEPTASGPTTSGEVAHADAGLAPASTSGPWPDRICVAQKAGRAKLVFENDCGCNEALVCSTSFDASARAIRVTLSIDESRGTFCRDCFAMVPGECDVPKLPANAALTLLINDARAISAETDAQAALPARCWDTGPGRNR